MDVRGNSRFRLAIVCDSGAGGDARIWCAARGSGTARPRRAAAAETSAVPLEKIHVLGDRPAPFGLNAKAAMIIDARSGATLYAYNEHDKIQPASLAKLMTFYLALKALHQGRLTPDTMVTVSEKAWRLSMNSTVSRMFLQVGQRVSVNDLLFGLMVSSGNDAAVALAEYLAGSSDAFAEQMNQQAKELGLDETHFENPDGLPVPEMYTTAFDMVKLGRAITQHFPDAVKYTGAKDFTFDKIHQPNFNALLFYDARVNGLKTGHVEEAGYHLVASAHSGGMDLISAVLGTPSSTARRVETEKLIDWAFRTFTSVQPDWHKALPDKLRVYGGDADTVAVAPAQHSQRHGRARTGRQGYADGLVQPELPGRAGQQGTAGRCAGADGGWQAAVDGPDADDGGGRARRIVQADDRSPADAAVGAGGIFLVILHEGCRSEGSTRSDLHRSYLWPTPQKRNEAIAFRRGELLRQVKCERRAARSVGEKWPRAHDERGLSVDSRVDVAAEKKWQPEVEEVAAKRPPQVVKYPVASVHQPQRVGDGEVDHTARAAASAAVDRAKDGQG